MTGAIRRQPGLVIHAISPESRVLAASGLIFVALSLTGIITIGGLPKPSESAPRYVTFFLEHRDSILTTNVLLSMANAALLIWFAVLRTRLGANARDSTLPALAFGSAVLFCALGAAAAMMPAGLAYYGPAGIAPATVRLCMDFYYVSNAFSATAIALAIGATALAGRAGTTPALPRWICSVSYLVATAELSATLTLKSKGAFSPDGAYGTGVVFGALTIWVLTTTITILTTNTGATAAGVRDATGQNANDCTDETPSGHGQDGRDRASNP